MHIREKLICVALLTGIGAATSLATIRYVNAAATGANDGTTWTNAYVSLQTALAAAQSGDQVWVAAGTYKPAGAGGDRGATFQLVSGVALYGGFAGTETLLAQRNVAANVTTLSGDLNGNDGANFTNYTENSYHVVTASAVDATAILDGFTIRSGNANGAAAQGSGGGLFASAGSPTIRNCVFTLNQAVTAGGMMFEDFSGPTLDTVQVRFNTATNNAGGVKIEGITGGPYAVVTVVQCTFDGNTAALSAAGAGGGLGISRCIATVKYCLFQDNVAARGAGLSVGPEGAKVILGSTFLRNRAGGPATFCHGGGLYFNGSPHNDVVQNCVFNGNRALNGVDGNGGGLQINPNANVRVANCIFVGNRAERGGAISNGSTSALRNLTIASNVAVLTGGGIYDTNDSASGAYVNCIVSGNTDSTGSGATSQIDVAVLAPTVTYSLAQGGWTGTGNINRDPLFRTNPNPGADGVWDGVNDNYGDLHLSAASPAVDAGSNSAVATDALDLDGDTNTSEPTPFDLSGSARFFDGCPNDTGSGTAPLVDIGAYESQFGPHAPAVLYVRAAATGANDGTSWANAFNHLQSALLSACPGDQIWVAAGTYTPDRGGAYPVGDRNASFVLVNGVTIYGAFAGNETQLSQRNSANVVILSGDLNGDDGANFTNYSDNSYHVVTASGVDASAVLDIVTIRGGNANGASTANRGGGLIANAGSPTLRNCIIAQNRAVSGGGLNFEGFSGPLIDSCQITSNAATNDSAGVRVVGNAGGPFATAVFLHCTFYDNAAPLIASGSGGGLTLNRCNAKVQYCLFQENVAARGAGAILGSEGQMSVLGSTFLRNVAAGPTGFCAGGGLRISNLNYTVVQNCVFQGNRATNGSDGTAGGLSVSNDASSARLANLIFVGNVADLGGAADVANPDAEIRNVTVAANVATITGGGVRLDASSGNASLANCIVWGNTDSSGSGPGAQISAVGSPASVTYSLVQGGYSGTGNINADPSFRSNPSPGPDGQWDGTNDNYGDVRLQTASPAIDAGNNAAVAADALDINGNGNTTEPMIYDVGARGRFREIITTPNTGAGTAPLVDMGAYESLAGPILVDSTPSGWLDSTPALQGALEFARSYGDEASEIWVAAGSYKPDVGSGIAPGDRTASFNLVSNVALYGGFTGSETARSQRNVSANATILTGDLALDDGASLFDASQPVPAAWAENSFHVVNAAGASNATLDGFVIRHGNANDPGPALTHQRGGALTAEAGDNITLRNCTISENNATNSGGGLSLHRVIAGPRLPFVLDSCVLERNRADASGGAIGDGDYWDLTVRSSTIADNFAGTGGGGGFYANSQTTAKFRDCQFLRNRGRSGGAISWNSQHDLAVIGCTFEDNRNSLADGHGGAMYIYRQQVTIVSSIFRRNSANESGGAIAATGNTGFPLNVHAINSVFVGNSALTGGAVACSGTDDGGMFKLTNCTIAENRATSDGGGVWAGANPPINTSSPTITNCIFWNNRDSGPLDSSAQIFTAAGAPVVNYSLVLGGWTGAGGTKNLTSEPGFVRSPSPGVDGLWNGVNDDYGDVSVFPWGAPIVDAGDGNAVPLDTVDIDSDGNTTEILPYDITGLAGHPRFSDDKYVPNTGNATPVDIGAYEMAPGYVATTPIVYIRTGATGADNGTSWANAYSNIHRGLTAAANSAGGVTQEVWIAAGTYPAMSPNGPRVYSLRLLDNIPIYGGFAGTETQRSQRPVDATGAPTLATIFTGDLNGNDTAWSPGQSTPASWDENAYHVVLSSYVLNGVLDGVTIMHGYANDANDPLGLRGGGALHARGSATYRNCRFIENIATAGGGGLNAGGYSDAGANTITVQNCTLVHNAANSLSRGGAASHNAFMVHTLVGNTYDSNRAYEGGGISIDADNAAGATIRTCVFRRNTGASSGGGISGTIQNPSVLENCLFEGNYGGNAAGAIALYRGNLPIVGSTFIGNRTGGVGGAIVFNISSGTAPQLTNCQFSGNRADEGSAIFNSGPSTTVTNCTFASNQATDSGAFSTQGAAPVLSNCVFWGNTSQTAPTAAQISVLSGSVTVRQSLVQDGWVGGTNILTGDPQFLRYPNGGADGFSDNPATAAVDESANDDYGDLRLRRTSPAVDAGSTAYLPADTADVDGDADTVETLPWDIAGGLRRVNDGCAADTGAGSTPFPDLGAYERGGSYAHPAGQAIIYVKASATGDNNGANWANAYTDLAEALCAAAGSNGVVQEIWVAAGTYKPSATGDRNESFQLVNGVGVYGGFAGNETQREQRDPDLHPTILTGDLNGNDQYFDPIASALHLGYDENSYHVVSATNAGAAPILDGFSIRGGFANGASENLVGAAIYATGGPLTVRHCRVFENYSFNYGAGLYHLCAAPAALLIEDCIFERNRAVNNGGSAIAALTNSTLDLRTSTIRRNSSGGGAVAHSSLLAARVADCVIEENIGNGLVTRFSTCSVLRTDFVGNRTTDNGAAIKTYLPIGLTLNLVGCRFLGNTSTASTIDPDLGGGAVYSKSGGSGGTIFRATNCLFAGNTAPRGGALMLADHDLTSGSAAISNCTFVDNRAVADGGGIWLGGSTALSGPSSPAIQNCIFWQNQDVGGADESAQIHRANGNPPLNYCLVQGGWTGAGGAGVITADPRFVHLPNGGADGYGDNPATTGTDESANDDYGDLRLRFRSPAVDAGSNALVPADFADADGDGNVAEATPLDAADELRFDDDPCAANSGAGTAPLVDLGAYERRAPATADVLFVKADATGTADGLTWDDAYTDLAEALCAAQSSGGIVKEVWVAEGTYKPTDTGDQNATFQLINGVAIYGGFSGDEISVFERDPDLYETILSGDLLGDDVEGEFPNGNSYDDNSHHVVTATGADATAVLDSITIAGGNAVGGAETRGGGMFMNPGSPTVANCLFQRNSASGSGGAGGAVGMASSSSPYFAGCTFVNNSAVNAGGDGGAASCVTTGSPVFRECVFSRNHAIDGGGAIYFGAGTPQCVLCRFDYNVADRGGALVITGPAVAQLASSTFLGNNAPQLGGAIANVGAVANVVSCAFVGNTSTGPIGTGGAVFNNVAVATPNYYANCTFTKNVATLGGGFYNSDGTGATSPRRTQIANSIFWSNANAAANTTGEQIRLNVSAATSPSVDYSTVQHGWAGPGANNSTADPNFVRLPSPGTDQIWDGGSTDDPGNLQLQAGSAAIDSGNNDLVLADAVDIDDDGNRLEASQCDAADSARFFQIGNPSTPAVDRGAYEASTGAGARIYVDAAAPPGGDGASWATAYNNLQTALDAGAAECCAALEIWVAAGTYRPGPPLAQGGNRNMTFHLRNAATIYGGFLGVESETDVAQRNYILNQTILSGDLNGDDPSTADNVYHVLDGTGATAASILDGFTIRGGAADAPRAGGGFFSLAGGPTLRNCTITGSTGSCGPDFALSGAQVTASNLNLITGLGGASVTHSVLDLQGTLNTVAGQLDMHGTTITGPGKLNLSTSATLMIRKAPICEAEVAARLAFTLPAGTIVFRAAEFSPPLPQRWELCDSGCAGPAPSVPVSDATVIGASGRIWTIAPTGLAPAATLAWTGSLLSQDLSVGGRANGKFHDGGVLTLTGQVFENGLPLYDGVLFTANVGAFQLQEMSPTPANTLAIVGALVLRPTGGFLVTNELNFIIGGAQALTFTLPTVQPLTNFNDMLTLTTAGAVPFALTPVSGAQSETILEGRISGTGQIQIEPGAKLVLAESARMNLTDGPDDDCVTLLAPGAPPASGLVTVLGTLIVQDDAALINSKVDVQLLDLQGRTDIVHNDIRLLADDQTGFGGEFFAAGNATVACNIIRSEGDRYLDLDPDPNDGESPTIQNNRIFVIIKQGTQSEQGELLELRTRDFDNGLAGGASGAIALGNSSGYSDAFALEEIEVLPDAKVNLTNRQNFVFQPLNITTPEAMYVKRIKLWPGAVFNTGLQRVYYQSLVDQNGAPLARNPSAPTALLANGSRIVDVPVLGFSLKVIAMENEAEFGVRVRTRLRDPADTQPTQPPFKQGRIVRDISPLGNNAMEMRTRDAVAGALNATSVAAHGSFARAAEDRVVVAFRYLFRPPTIQSGAGAGQLVVYLSDAPEGRDPARLSEPGYAAHYVEIARINPPTDTARPGGSTSDEFATFYGVFPRGLLNFTRGTYVELELRGSDAVCWIDDWDPQIYCTSNCGDLSAGQGAIDNEDFLLLLSETGRKLNPFDSRDNGPCLDAAFSGDKYVDLSDVFAFDAFIDGVQLNVCDSGSGGVAGGGTCPPAPTAVSGLSPDSLVIAGKAGATDLEDRIFNTTLGGACIGPSKNPASTPDPVRCFRSNGRLVADHTGALHQLHAIQGLVRLDNASVVLRAGLDTSTPIPGASVRVGVDATGFLPVGVPLVDVAFHPSNNTIVYVAPVIVDEPDVPGTHLGNPYRAAAKLQLTGGGAFNVLAIYGPNPESYSTVGSTIASGDVIYAPDYTRIREIEVDALGNVYVLAAQAIDNTDYLLTYDEAAAHPAPRIIALSAALPGAGIAGAAPRGPAQMLVSRVVANRLYFTQNNYDLQPNLPDATGQRVRVLRCNILRGGGGAPANAATGIALAAAVDLDTTAASSGDMGLGYRSQATALAEHPLDGRLFVLGIVLPRTPLYLDPAVAQSMFVTDSPTWLRPFFASVATTQSGTLPVTSICTSIALPAGIGYVPIPPQACCLANGTCQSLTPANCSAASGLAQGTGTVCSPNPCPQPRACCLAGNVCQSLVPATCAAQGGTAQGVGSVCTPNPCAPAYPRGDMNCDHLFNNFDIDPFVLAIVDAPTWQAQHPGCPLLNGDMNNDALFNNFDIDPFVACLIGGGCP